jgi:hypothetical protein
MSSQARKTQHTTATNPQNLTTLKPRTQENEQGNEKDPIPIPKDPPLPTIQNQEIKDRSSETNEPSNRQDYHRGNQTLDRPNITTEPSDHLDHSSKERKSFSIFKKTSSDLGAKTTKPIEILIKPKKPINLTKKQALDSGKKPKPGRKGEQRKCGKTKSHCQTLPGQTRMLQFMTPVGSEHGTQQVAPLVSQDTSVADEALSDKGETSSTRSEEGDQIK